VGVDLSEASIATATAAGHPNAEFLVGDISTMALGRFDLVVLNEVLYYAEDAPAFLEGLRAHLEPGGVVLVSMWRHPGDQALWRSVAAAFPVIDRVEVRNSGNPVNPRGWQVAMCGVLGSGPLGERDEAEVAVPGQ
jgi:2-polyprenyl-6-hydroxyphenyl methylase/3-demethylubiquinone-9 3-methyltransferase